MLGASDREQAHDQTNGSEYRDEDETGEERRVQDD